MRPAADIVEAVVEDYRQGLPVLTIAKKHGISPSRVCVFAREHGLGRGNRNYVTAWRPRPVKR